jgi:hypothetical protein
MKTLMSSKAEYLPIRRQMRVFEREKLDLLTLDINAVPTIFEFKRDLADYASVSQLLTYGAYVARWSMAQLDAFYIGGDYRRDLDRAFQARFHKELPAELPHQVNLVLAAFEFSLPCRRALEFLEQSTGLIIGRLKIECLWDLQKLPRPVYRWLQRPVPTKALDIGSEPGDPKQYYMLQQYVTEFPFDWESCVNNGIIPVPESWNVEKNQIPPGSGIFVYLAGLPDNYGDEPGSGLVGYGITSDVAFDLWPKRNQYELSDQALKQMDGEGKFHVLPVDWVQTRFGSDPAPPRFPLPPTWNLSQIFDRIHIQGNKEDLEANPYFSFCDSPPDTDCEPGKEDDGIL